MLKTADEIKEMSKNLGKLVDFVFEQWAVSMSKHAMFYRQRNALVLDFRTAYAGAITHTEFGWIYPINNIYPKTTHSLTQSILHTTSPLRLSLNQHGIKKKL